MRKPSVGWRGLLAGLLICSGSVAGPTARAGDAKTSIASEASLSSQRFTLPNGLTVLLAPDAEATRVALRVTYDLGAKDDPHDARGMSEVIERLLADPSTRHVPRSTRFALFRALGIDEWKTDVAAAFDQTQVTVVVPPSDVALALWFESDRMGFFLDGADDELVREKAASVVPSGWDTQPTFRLGRAALFAADHPYGGELDLSKATARAVREHARKYCAPRNTVLALAGSFDPKVAKAQIEEHFGPLEGAPKPPAPAVTKVAQTAEKRVRGESSLPHPRVAMLWATPAFLETEDAAFDGLARILDERLTARHVDGSKVAVEASAHQSSAAIASVFEVRLTAATGHSADEMERLLDDEIDKIRKEGPTAEEASRASRAWLTSRAFDLGRQANRAYLLSTFFLVKNDTSFLKSWLASYEGLTASKLRDAAEKHLTKAQRVVVTVMPNPLAPPYGRRLEGGGL